MVTVSEGGGRTLALAMELWSSMSAIVTAGSAPCGASVVRSWVRVQGSGWVACRPLRCAGSPSPTPHWTLFPCKVVPEAFPHGPGVCSAWGVLWAWCEFQESGASEGQTWGMRMRHLHPLSLTLLTSPLPFLLPALA